MKTETFRGLLAAARLQLADTGINTAALDARLLLLEATGLSHEDLISIPDRRVDPRAAATFQGYLERRLAHEPVSRILGRREFYGRTFKVTPDVFDPRPDTEVLVEMALRLVPRGRFIDLGTGSGAIAITLCTENPALTGIAADLSQAAIAVAKGNAQALMGATQRLSFLQGSWLEGARGHFDLIVSNPPYIGTGENLPPEVRDFDPPMALFAGPEDLEAYEIISREAPAHIATGGIVAVEIGSTQFERVRAIFEKAGFALIDASKDLFGHIRALAFRFS